MKKIMETKIFLVIITAIICTTTVVGATALYNASEIGFTPSNSNWKVNNLNDAINDLYNNGGASGSVAKFCTFVESEYGDPSNHLSVGSKYSCDPGDGTKRNFYVLAVDTNKVKLIMEHNITEGSNATTMTWMNAMKYFVNGAGASIKTSWKNVIDVDLPMAQDIANAVGNTSWKVEDNNYDGWFCLGLKDHSSCSAGNWAYTTDAGKEAVAPYKWLFNYTRRCSAFGCDETTSLGDTEAYGYWTRDIIAQQKDSTGRAWCLGMNGHLGITTLSDSAYGGVRPVITVLKSNLVG